MCAGCRSENWCFFVCHACSSCAWGTQFKQVFCDDLRVDFDAVSSSFFGMGCSFRCTTYLSFSLLGGATIFAKLRSKIAKSPKISGKVMRTTSCRQLRDLKKVQCSSLGPRMQMCTYIEFFLHDHYIALTAIVKLHSGSPKTAQNEQVCAHQKSYVR